MRARAAHESISPEEYLERERASEERHEYRAGRIVPLPGGTAEHSLITTNLICELGNALENRPCDVLGCDMRIGVPHAATYTYADTCVVCGRPELEDANRDTLLNPTIVIEVLSDSTEGYDRGDKFAQYQTLPSMKEYVLASQKKPRIEVFTRQPDESWLLRTYGPGEIVPFASVGCEIAVDRAYLDVFDRAAPSPAA